jgi:hypothetical protein
VVNGPNSSVTGSFATFVPRRHRTGAFRSLVAADDARKIPLLGDSREARWALRRDELFREQNRLLVDQNRLLAGLLPLPREDVPDVIEGSRPRRAPRKE